MRFRFLATDKNGKVIKGEIVANNKTIASDDLVNRGFEIQLLQVYKDKQKKKESFLKKCCNFFALQKIQKSNWKCQFFEQFSVLLASELPIEQCLSSLSGVAKNKGPSTAIIEILQEKIASGMSLSEAMMCCDFSFSEMEIKTVKAAEKIGKPAAALHELSKFNAKISTIKNKLNSALIYPAIVLTAASFALILLMTTIVPKFETIFAAQSQSHNLPWLTQKIVNLCKFFGKNIISILAFILVIPIASKICSRTKFFRRKASVFYAKIPIIGGLMREIDLSNFFRTIGMLMSFGISFQEALSLATSVVRNRTLKGSFERLKGKIAQGKTLSDSFRENKELPTMDYGLIVAGERSGTLLKSFLKIADIYDEKIKSRTALLTTIIEPAITIFLAIIVGTIVIAMFLPMVSLMQSIRI